MNDFDYMIDEFMRESGFTAYYIKRSGEYDPSAEDYEPLEKKIPVQAILMDFTLQSNGLVSKYGTTILAGDKQIYIKPPHKEGRQKLDIDPTKDIIKVGNIEYKVASMREINTTGTDAILYELHLRR